jgi:hypothetical protein
MCSQFSRNQCDVHVICVHDVDAKVCVLKGVSACAGECTSVSG